MEREIQIEGKTYRLACERDAGALRVSVDGTDHRVRYLPLLDGRLLCIVDGLVIEWDGSGNGPVRVVRTEGDLSHLEVVDPRRRLSSSASGGVGAGSAELKAPMPGKVVAVLCEEGQEVEAGAGIVVLEAMKMENELRSPIAGVVAVLEAEPGQSVEMGQRVAVIEPPAGAGGGVE